MSFEEEFRAQFPVRSERFSLELPSDWTDEDSGEVHEHVRDNGPGDVWATVRSVSWDVDGETMSIRDVKEQEVLVLSAQHREDPRLSAYVAGWAAAAQYILDRHAELAAAGALEPRVAELLELSMPSDFFAPDVLALRRPQTAEDFTDALLSSRKRLGKLLP